MTTPTPAQQHIEVLRELRTESVLCDIDPVVTDALDYALAALEAVGSHEFVDGYLVVTGSAAYRKGFADGYERRQIEVQGALV